MLFRKRKPLPASPERRGDLRKPPLSSPPERRREKIEIGSFLKGL